MPDPRLYVDAALAAGARLQLGEGPSRKLTQILRLGIGAQLRVFNAVDGEWRARIDAAPRAGVEIALETRLREPFASPDLVLLFAPVKRDATDLIVEKAVELGVRALRPVITRRTIVETVRLDRFAAIARDACEQCERFDLPDIAPPQNLARALDAWDHDRPLLYADEAGDDEHAAWGGTAGRAPPLIEALNKVRAGKLAVLTGPEGGFDPEERRLLRSLPFVISIALGPRILRAETAVIAALAVIQAAWGDWRALKTPV